MKFSRVVSDVEEVVGRCSEEDVEDTGSGGSPVDAVNAVVAVVVVDVDVVVDVEEEEEPEGVGDGC